MKTKTVFLAAGALLLALFLCVIPAAAEDSVTDKVISVTGYGESIAEPDMATITLGIETENPNASKAQKENAEKMDKVIAALKAAGIADKDIKTSQYSMYSYDVSKDNSGKYDAGTTVYHVTNTVSAVTYDVSKVGDVIDRAVAAGANRVNNLQFSLSDEKQKQERKAALISAVKAARADADAVADALGLTIKGPGLISVDRSYTPVSYASVNLTAKEDAMMAPKAAAAGRVSTSIEAGTLSTTATVSITFLY